MIGFGLTSKLLGAMMIDTVVRSLSGIQPMKLLGILQVEVLDVGKFHNSVLVSPSLSNLSSIIHILNIHFSLILPIKFSAGTWICTGVSTARTTPIRITILVLPKVFAADPWERFVATRRIQTLGKDFNSHILSSFLSSGMKLMCPSSRICGPIGIVSKAFILTVSRRLCYEM